MKEYFNIDLPVNVRKIIELLYNNGYEAFAVGGCVRDSLLNKPPSDWDITTNAIPEIIEKIFSPLYKTLDIGLKHGTITILIDNIGYEVTTYRIDGEYEDNRRPKAVIFTSDIQKDLCRRDFTINAMAYNPYKGLMDFNNGLQDLKAKTINTVGDADLRFNEDGLRMLRAVRFSSVLKFQIDSIVKDSIRKNSFLLKNISKERIRDEFNKILLSQEPSFGIKLLHEVGLLKYIVPEIISQINLDQKNKYHNLTLFEHTLKVLDLVPPKLDLRLAGLLHDIGKVSCFTIDDKGNGHFYNHENIGEKISEKILKGLRYDNNTINKISSLIKNHNIHNYKSEYKIKKFINKIGKDNLDDLFTLVIADRCSCDETYSNLNDIYTLENKCNEIISKNLPLSLKNLSITGEDLLKLGIGRGKVIGEILNYLLEEVLKNPSLNNKDILIEISLKYCKKKKYII